MVCGPHHGIKLRSGIGVSNNETQLFSVVGTEIDREQTVDFAAKESLDSLFDGSEATGFKAEYRILLTGLRICQDIGQRSFERLRTRIEIAEGKKVRLVAHADGAVILIPLQLVGSQKAGKSAGFVVLCSHLLVEVPVVLHDAVHGCIQFLLEIRALLINSKIGIRKPHLPHGQYIRRVSIRVQGYKGVDLAAFQHSQQLRGLFRQLDDDGMYIVICRPFDKLLFLNAVFIDADPLSA